ncbi:MAG: nucleotidyltransferase domain-containing protein [Peptococcaceae bacterium]|nr:nucleotidyltransferase domain-containing protein [Peptococcaceae bacterium]
MASRKVEIEIKDFVKLLREKNIRVEQVILFGSHAAGKAHKDSDIDVAIISPDLGKDRVEEMVMLKEIAESVDYDISPRPYSVEQFKKAGKGQFLYDEIIKKGRPIKA